MFTCLTPGAVVSLFCELVGVPVPVEPGVKAWVLHSPEARMLSRKSDARRIMVSLPMKNDEDVYNDIVGCRILRIHASMSTYVVLEQMIKKNKFG